jgi:hypothetical protein
MSYVLLGQDHCILQEAVIDEYGTMTELLAEETVEKSVPVSIYPLPISHEETQE